MRVFSQSVSQSDSQLALNCLISRSATTLTQDGKSVSRSVGSGSVGQSVSHYSVGQSVSWSLRQLVKQYVSK